MQGGKYRILRVLGQGGFGITYLARHEVLHTEVAIKELFLNAQGTFCTRNPENRTVLPHFDAERFEEFREKFTAEARTLARLKGIPGLVQVLDIFNENETAYFVMEYVEGPSLKKFVEDRGPFSPQEAVSFIVKLLEGLSKVHQKGVLHRDINPNNILVGQDGGPILIDFGISREYEEETTLTQTTFRTPGYSAPEQAVLKARRGPFTDLYGVGATLFFMLTGQRPQTTDEADLEGPLSLRSLNPDIAPELEAVVMKAMSRRPDERFQNADDMKKALLAATQSAPVNRPPLQDDVTQLDVQETIPPAVVSSSRSPNGPTVNSPPFKPEKAQPKSEEKIQPSESAEKRNNTAVALLGVLGFLTGVAIYLFVWPGILKPRPDQETSEGLKRLIKKFEEEKQWDSALHYAKIGRIKFTGDTAFGPLVEKLEILALLASKTFTVEKQIREGDSLFDRSLFSEARRRYEEALKNAPPEKQADIQAKIDKCVALEEPLPPLVTVERERDAATKALRNQLIGRHSFTHAHIHINQKNSGFAEFWEENGTLKMRGTHYGGGERFEMEGTVKEILPKSFKVSGNLSYLGPGAQGGRCTRLGTFTFRKENSSLWQFNNTQNSCVGTFDWVDLELK